MNTEQAKQLSEAALDRLMAALEQGQSAALKQYLAVMSRFRRYSWGNVLLIYSQLGKCAHSGLSQWSRVPSLRAGFANQKLSEDWFALWGVRI